MASGGIYKFVCDEHGKFEEFTWDADVAKVCCPKCAKPAQRDVNRDTGFKTMYSDAMGVHASQVAEHRRLHPDIPLTDDGRVIIKSARENERICKKLGPGWAPTR